MRSNQRFAFTVMIEIHSSDNNITRMIVSQCTVLNDIQELRVREEALHLYYAALVGKGDLEKILHVLVDQKLLGMLRIIPNLISL